MNIAKCVVLAFVLSSACEQSMGCAMWGEFSYSNECKYSSAQDFKSKLLGSIKKDLEQNALSKKIGDNIGPIYEEIRDVAVKKLREQNNEIKDAKCKEDDKSVIEWIERSVLANRSAVLERLCRIHVELSMVVREQLEKTKRLDDLLKSPGAQDNVYDGFVAMMLRISCLGSKNESAGNENDSIRKILSDLNGLKKTLSDKIKEACTQKSDVIEKSTRTKFTTSKDLEPKSVYTAFQNPIPNQYLQEVINENLAETCFEYVRFLMVDFLGICVPNMSRRVDDPVIIGCFHELRNIDGFDDIEDIFKGVSY